MMRNRTSPDNSRAGQAMRQTSPGRALVLGWLCSALYWGWLGSLPVSADQPSISPTHASHASPAAGAQQDDHSRAAAHRGPAEHNAADLSNANAGPHQEDPVEIRGDLALWTLVVFILLLLILRKFAWGPICDALDHREQSIANNLAEAQRSHDEAKRLLAEHEARLAQTAGQVRALMDEARRDAEAQQQAILAEAEAAAANQKQRALKEIDAAKNAALADLARASVDQALGLAGRIVGQELRADDHDRLIQDALAKFPSKN